MPKFTSQNQLSFADFKTPFDQALDENNRWVKLATMLPWDSMCDAYNKHLSPMGRPEKPARMVIGAVIIKHKLGVSDRETIAQIQENPYLQYFVGLHGFQTKQIFAPSLFVDIRKRLGADVFDAFHQSLLDLLAQVEQNKSKASATKTKNPSNEDSHDSDTTESETPDDKPSNGSVPNIPEAPKTTPPENQGKLIIDATIAEQAIRFPTDLSLLNEARELSETIIDYLYKWHALTEKPRTYRRQARASFVSLVKQRRPSKKKLKHAIKSQLQYLRRNFKSIESMLNMVPKDCVALPYKMLRQYWIIQHVYAQQLEMYQNKTNRCDDRIVSIHQPHVRPIIRGKAHKKTEFGSKLNVSMDKHGLAYIERLDWDAYHEGNDLPNIVESYKARYGFYPEVVMVDTLYGTRANRKYLKDRGIRYGGKPLGRPKKETTDNKVELAKAKKQRTQDYRQRIPIEGKFGQGKNGYGLNLIKAKLALTSEAWVRSIFLVMNIVALERLLINLILRVRIYQNCLAHVMYMN